jgi:succinate dehydrogenase / fumarate reductase, flavoprotein subunit
MEKHAVVIGAGLSGLSCAMRLAFHGIFVHLISLMPARRSQSVCAQGGINAVCNIGEDTPVLHAYETIKGGDFLADQPPVIEMCMAAPSIIKMLDQIGCLFNRTENKEIDFRKFGGSLYKRTAFCNTTTGQQLMYSLDEQVRKFEVKNLIKRYEHYEFLRLIKDDNGKTKGVILQDIYDLKIFSILSDVVVIAAGGLGVIFGKSTNSFMNTGYANARLFSEGMQYANAEFIQVHPTTIPGKDKYRVITEAARGEGARIWVYGDENKKIEFPNGKMNNCGKTNEKWYFLEEMYPEYKNLVPRDIAAREILKVCELGLGIDKKDQVFLDVTHLSKDNLKKISSVLDLYKKYTLENPEITPMRIFIAMHYSMGGAWVDWPAIDDVDRQSRFRQMTNIEGLFSIGESDFEFHGANRLGANSLLSCIFSGLTAANEIKRFLETTTFSSNQQVASIIKEEENVQKKLIYQNGKENIFKLLDEMGELMLKNVTVKRNNKDLQKTLDKLNEIKNRFQNVCLDDKSNKLNQSFLLARQFPYMLKLALVITKAALLRNESRGSHYKEEFSKRDDPNFLKTSIATYNPTNDEINISYKKVDTRYFTPTQRTYDKKNELPSLKSKIYFEEVL